MIPNLTELSILERRIQLVMRAIDKALDARDQREFVKACLRRERYIARRENLLADYIRE